MWSQVDVLGAFEAAGAVGLGNDADAEAVVSALRRMSLAIVDPSAQRSLADGGGAGVGGGQGAAGPSAGTGPRDCNYSGLMARLCRWVAHPDTRVAAVALQTATDAVSHLSWAGSSVPSIATLLMEVAVCLEREPLRRAVRLLYSATISKLGPKFALEALVATGRAATSVRVLRVPTCPRSQRDWVVVGPWGVIPAAHPFSPGALRLPAARFCLIDCGGGGVVVWWRRRWQRGAVPAAVE